MLISIKEPDSHAMTIGQGTPTVYVYAVHVACRKPYIAIHMSIEMPAPPPSHVAQQGKLRASE